MATRGAVGTGCEFRDELIRHGVLIARGARGMYGLQRASSKTPFSASTAWSRSDGAGDAPDVMRFSPLLQPSAFRAKRIP